LRGNVPGSNLRSYYTTLGQGIYELEIDVFMQLQKQSPGGRLYEEAFEASEGRRARGLIEMLREAQVEPVQGVNASLVEQLRALQRRLNAKAELQSRLLTGKYDQERADEVAKELDDLTLKYGELETRIAAGSPRYAALTSPEPQTLKQ